MDFAAIAHDLRSPLNVMLGHMQMLAAEGISEVSRRRLEILDRQIHRMIRLLDSCGKQPYQLPSFSAVDLNTTIRNAIAEFEVIFARRGIQIVVSMDKPLPLVVGDADLLHRVLVNVLTNAADSITAGGRIEIGALAEKLPNMPVTTVYVEIRDSGSGIPVDVIPTVFEDGFTTKRNGEGHGLGLGICREIVQRHGGRIELSSELGKGTTVCLWLPAFKPRQSQVSPLPSVPAYQFVGRQRTGGTCRTTRNVQQRFGCPALNYWIDDVPRLSDSGLLGRRVPDRLA